MATKRIVVCDICFAKDARTYSALVGSIFDGHRNEANHVSFDLCESCDEIVEKSTDFLISSGLLREGKDRDLVKYKSFLLLQEVIQNHCWNWNDKEEGGA